MKAAIVMTTIYDPVVLDSYRRNLDKYGHLGDTVAIVIPDTKTPKGAAETCRKLSEQGLHILLPDLEQQEEFLDYIGIPRGMVPLASDNRRNVGYLMALNMGVDFVISVDDDNYWTDDQDFFEEHSVVAKGPTSQSVYGDKLGWINVCDFLDFDHGEEKRGAVYPRGFPYFARHVEIAPKYSREEVNVHVNTGLWSGHPDLDAMTWLVSPCTSTKLIQAFSLSKDTWSPVNSQNTAVRREALASYYFIPMGTTVNGLPLEHDGDIFQGYFAQACVKKLGGAVRVGTPVATHMRNGHNHLKDAHHELGCILLLEEMLPWLTDLNLHGDSYEDVYEDLAYALTGFAEERSNSKFLQGAAHYLTDVAGRMRVWARICRSLA